MPASDSAAGPVNVVTSTAPPTSAAPPTTHMRSRLRRPPTGRRRLRRHSSKELHLDVTGGKDAAVLVGHRHLDRGDGHGKQLVVANVGDLAVDEGRVALERRETGFGTGGAGERPRPCPGGDVVEGPPAPRPARGRDPRAPP